jgi:hypothetical protein
LLSELNVDKIDQLRKLYCKYFYNVNKNILEREIDSDVLQEKQVEINGEKYKFYYLPIVPVLKKILADPIAMKYIMKFHRGKLTNQLIYKINFAFKFFFRIMNESEVK